VRNSDRRERDVVVEADSAGACWDRLALITRSLDFPRFDLCASDGAWQKGEAEAARTAGRRTFIGASRLGERESATSLTEVTGFTPSLCPGS
jgi:hypothetical protein